MNNEFNEGFKTNHPAQAELVSWLQDWRNQHGVAGKRKPIERYEEQQPVPQPTQRRKVTYRRRKLVDE